VATGEAAWVLPEAAGDARMKYSELGAMSEEQLKAFLEAVKADADLQEQLKAAGDADAVVAIAKAAGFVISAEELQRDQAEISEEELEDVAGGRPKQTYWCSNHCSWECTNTPDSPCV